MLIPGEDYEDYVLRYNATLHESFGPAGKDLDRYGRMYIFKVRKNIDD